MIAAGAVGFFDSGIAGLSVLRHAVDTLQGMPLLYVADSAYAPHGARPLRKCWRVVAVYERACRDSVSRVEQGAQGTPCADDLVNTELAPSTRLGVDTYVLGGTHFPFLQPTIRTVVGAQATLFDPGPAVIGQLRRRLGLAPDRTLPAPVRLFSSGDCGLVQRRVKALIGLRASRAGLPV